jgi:hypothetical protein
MNSTRCHKTPVRGLLQMAVLLAALAGNGRAQVIISVYAPSNTVVVNAGLQLTPSISDLAGTPLDPSSLTWATGDGTIAAVSPAGRVTGIFPGDVSITVADPDTGISLSTPIHVIPAAVSIQVTPQRFHVAEQALLSATAVDAGGKPINGLKFQFRSGEPGIAAVGSDGTLTGLAEGLTTIGASIAGVSSNPALEATAQVQVLPKLAYKIGKVIATDTNGSTTITGYNSLSVVNASEIASLVTLANGSQAAVLLEHGKTRVLAVAGQKLPNLNRMVTRLGGISANSNGDVALLVETPAPWCSVLVVIFPHSGPEQQVGTDNCSNSIHAHSMGEDGNVLYRVNDQIYLANATGTPKLLFSIASQPASNEPISSVNDFYPGGGKFVLNTNLSSGKHVYFLWDGRALSRTYSDGDAVRSRGTTNIDSPAGTADGNFYVRANGNNFEALVQLTATGVNPLLVTGDNVPGGTLAWIHGVDDATGGSILFRGDFSVGPYHTSLAAWESSGAVVEYSQIPGWGASISSAMTAGGTVFFSGLLNGETKVPGLRSIAGRNGTPAMVLATGANFPQPAPAGMDWRFNPIGGSATAIPAKSAGDSIITIDSSTRTLASIGDLLPNGKTAMWIGGGIANESGDILFTAGYPTGSGLFRYRAGKLDTLQDTGVTGTGPAGSSVSWFNSGRWRFLAMNNKGDAVSVSGYGSVTEIVALGSSGPKLVATQRTAAPGGGNFTNFQTVTMDDNGRVLFSSQTSDGKTGVYFWNGQSVTRVVGIADSGPYGLTVNEVSNIAASGTGFTIMLAFGNYQIRELRSFDGQQMKTIVSTDTTLLDGTGINYFFNNATTLSANGDAHYLAATQDGGLGVYAHKADGRDVIVARSRDQMPGGEWLINPIGVNSSLSGEVYFTADVLSNGVESLVLYLATPQ